MQEVVSLELPQGYHPRPLSKFCLFASHNPRTWYCPRPAAYFPNVLVRRNCRWPRCHRSRWHSRRSCCFWKCRLNRRWRRGCPLCCRHLCRGLALFRNSVGRHRVLPRCTSCCRGWNCRLFCSSCRSVACGEGRKYRAQARCSGRSYLGRISGRRLGGGRSRS